MTPVWKLLEGERLISQHMTWWDEWRGNEEGQPVFFIKRLLRFRGRSIDLHKMVAADQKGCFHSHPAYAIRIVLYGGYSEEMRDSTKRFWFPGMIGLVPPKLVHRIDSLLNDRVSYSLWLRGKVRAKVQFGCD